MTNRFHAHQYTAEEIASMEAGPLLDWLALQGLGGEVKENPLTVKLCREDCTWGIWYLKDNWVDIVFDSNRISTSKDIGRWLDRLREMGYQPQLFVNDEYKWECAIIIDHAEFGSGIADSIGTALARALADKARREQGNG